MEPPKFTYTSILKTLLQTDTKSHTDSHSTIQTTTSSTKTTKIKATTPPLLPRATIRPLNASLTARIASLQLHPSLEALLHILNGELAAAHFLVRHMQQPVPLIAPSPTSSAPSSPLQRQVNPQYHREGSGRGGEDATSVSPHPDAPKIEGMHLHAVLHRLEGDFDNAAAWYRSVARASPPPLNADSEMEGDASESQYASAKTPLTVFNYVFPAGLVMPLALIRDTRRLREGASKHGRFHVDEIEHLSAEARRWHEEKVRLEDSSRRELVRLLQWLEARYGTSQWSEASQEFVGMGAKHGALSEKMIVGGEGWRQF